MGSVFVSLLAEAPAHVLWTCVLVGAAGTLMLYPIAYPSSTENSGSRHAFSAASYSFISAWSFFVGNLLFLVRALAVEIGLPASSFVKAFDENHMSLFAFSSNMIGSFAAIAAYHSSSGGASPVVAASVKTPAKKKARAKRKRSSSRKKQ